MQAEYNMPVGGDTDAYIRTLVNYTPSNPNAPDNFTAEAYALVNERLATRSFHELDVVRFIDEADL